MTEAEAQDFYEEDEDHAPLWARLELAVDSVNCLVKRFAKSCHEVESHQ